ELQKIADEYLELPLFETYSKEVVVKDQIQVINLERPSSIPSICGLALKLNIHRDTIYRWGKEEKPFYDTLERLRQKQKDFLLYHGLTRGYDSAFAKFVSVNMTDMRDKIDSNITQETIQINIDKDDVNL
ncbi:unnamed protein product, partial [marine sediment metagenome]